MTNSPHVLITGASSGIGEALALYYAKQKNMRLSLCGRNQERLSKVAELCRAHGAEVRADTLDVTDAKALENWINSCHKEKALTLVFANAGVATTQEIPENIRRTFEINITGVVNTVLPTVALFRSLPKDAEKQLVLMSSIAGYRGLPSCPSYSASKAAVKAWGQALRGQLKREGIKVSTVCPGFVRSRITDQNTCPMPFFMEADKAAELIAKRVAKNTSIIAFPWPMRLSAWLGSILPAALSDRLYEKLPCKV